MGIVRSNIDSQKIGFKFNNAIKCDKKGELTLEIIRDLSIFDSLSDEWNALVDESNAQIFQTFEWQRTWWKYFGEQSDSHILHILLFREDERLVGIAPFFVDHFKVLGQVLYKCLRFIGSKVMQDNTGKITDDSTATDYLDLIIRPGYAEPVLAALLDHFRTSNEFDDVIMDEVMSRSTLLTRLVPMIQKSDEEWGIIITDTSVCPIIEFQDSWDQFMKKLSGNMRYQVRKYMKRADDSSRKKVFKIRQIGKEEEIESSYEQLVRYHQKRWNGLGTLGVFYDYRINSFYKEVTSLFHKKGWAKIYELSVMEDKEERVAYDLIFQFKDTFYLVQRGFNDTSSYAAYGPGNTLLYSVLRDAAESNYRIFDFLRGDEEYKFRVATSVNQNKSLVIQNVSTSRSFYLFLYRKLQGFISLWLRLRFEWHIFKILAENSNLSGINRYGKNVYYRILSKLKKSNPYKSV